MPYRNHPIQVSDSDEPISIGGSKSFHRYLEMKLAEKEAEEKFIAEIDDDLEHIEKELREILEDEK